MKLPKHIFGINTEEALARYLAESKKDPEPTTEDQLQVTPSNSSMLNPQKYIILPGRQHGTYSYPDMLVEKERTLYGKNWQEAQKALQEDNACMLTIRQFVDLVALLQTGNVLEGTGNKLSRPIVNKILEDIITLQNPWRGEWLDAKFSLKGKFLNKKAQITYHRIEKRKLQPITEPLEKCLRENKLPGIDLEYWLKNATVHGLPVQNTPAGNLYYWHPQENCVAWFYAGSIRACLYCDVDPQDSVALLGVRAARVRV